MLFKYTDIQDAITDLHTFLQGQISRPIIAFELMTEFKRVCYSDHLIYKDKTDPFAYLNHLLGVELKGRRFPCFVYRDHWYKDKYCIAPLFSTAYWPYKQYLTLFKEVGAQLEEIHADAYFPLVERDELPLGDFRAFLKERVNFTVNPLFFGARAQEVSWRLVSCDSPEVEKVLLDTVGSHLDHNFGYYQKFGSQDYSYPHHFGDLARPWLGAHSMMKEHYFISALDLRTNLYVGAMAVYLFGDTAHCSQIACHKGQEYRKYSLVLASQLATIQEIFYTDKFPKIKTIDLGCNTDPCAEYKEVMTPKKVQLENVRKYETLAQLETFLG